MSIVMDIRSQSVKLYVEKVIKQLFSLTLLDLKFREPLETIFFRIFRIFSAPHNFYRFLSFYGGFLPPSPKKKKFSSVYYVINYYQPIKIYFINIE